MLKRVRLGQATPSFRSHVVICSILSMVDRKLSWRVHEHEVVIEFGRHNFIVTEN